MCVLLHYLPIFHEPFRLHPAAAQTPPRETHLKIRPQAVAATARTSRNSDVNTLAEIKN